MAQEKNTKIKLVEVIADSGIGGGPKHVLGLLRHIDKDKFSTYLFCPSGYLRDQAREISGLTVLPFEPRSKFDLVAIYLLKKSFERIRSLGDPFSPLIIHSHGSRAGLMARVAAVFGSKKVYTEHILDQNYHLKNPLNELIQKWIIKRQNKKTDIIIAVSNSVKKFLIKSGLADKSRVVMIPNGIEKKEGVTTKKIKASNKAPIIGTIGSLNKQKGQKYLLEALSILKRKYPLITLEIIGKGPERIPLLEKIDELNLEHHVALLGAKKETENYLKHWDVFVLPSISETFGISILEAMEVGVPVVASNVGGIPDIITNKKNGLLVSPHNPKEIAEAVENIISHPVMAAKLKRAGRETTKEYDWKKIVDLLEAEYEKLVETNATEDNL